MACASATTCSSGMISCVRNILFDAANEQNLQSFGHGAASRPMCAWISASPPHSCEVNARPACWMANASGERFSTDSRAMISFLPSRPPSSALLMMRMISVSMEVLPPCVRNGATPARHSAGLPCLPPMIDYVHYTLSKHRDCPNRCERNQPAEDRQRIGCLDCARQGVVGSFSARHGTRPRRVRRSTAARSDRVPAASGTRLSGKAPPYGRRKEGHRAVRPHRPRGQLLHRLGRVRPHRADRPGGRPGQRARGVGRRGRRLPRAGALVREPGREAGRPARYLLVCRGGFRQVLGLHQRLGLLAVGVARQRGVRHHPHVHARVLPAVLPSGQQHRQHRGGQCHHVGHHVPRHPRR